MAKSITKVKTKSQAISDAAKPIGWKGVLVDIQADIAYLKKLVPIVERKIARGEPWPGDSATQN
jgi:hypothetical protein